MLKLSTCSQHQVVLRQLLRTRECGYTQVAVKTDQGKELLIAVLGNMS